MVELTVKATCGLCRHAQMSVANGAIKLLCDYGDAKNICDRWIPNRRDMRHLLWVSEQAASASVPSGELALGSTVALPEKKEYGEFKKVRLTDEEHAKLKLSYGQALEKAIEHLDNYMVQGHKYKSCYATMKKDGWVWQRTFQDSPLRNPSKPVATGLVFRNT